MKIKLFISISLFFLFKTIYAQNPYTLLRKTIYVNEAKIIFDTVAVLPYKFDIYSSKGNKISDSLYRLNYKEATIYFKQILNDSIYIYYVPFNKYIPLNIHRKPLSLIIRDSVSVLPSKSFFYFPNSEYNDFFGDELTKRGSISRSIRIGNNQNMSVSSTLNLQLTGKIGDDFEMIAALTDNQVPFQPSGNTQQIQEFDKIYIQIFNNKNHFTLGDYDLKSDDHVFLKINRKSQGFQYNFKNIDTLQTIQIQTSNSVVKGKYHRMTFNGKEGIQGPYKLQGVNQEPFIVILAGTERIYIDGKLLIRGEENDYIIDYNTAEITFTIKNIITKDSRIVAEFEYSDRNYARFGTYNKVQYNNKKTSVQFQLFHEFDAKNQTLQQELTDNEKRILSLAGNDENKMIVPFISIDTLFNENQIYYKLIDTIVNGITYDSVLVYSTDSSALYRVGFTYVGKNKGNYIQTSSTANGRVFKWIAPINGVPQGDFEPIRKLIAPMKHTVAATSLSYHLNNNTNISLDIAISNFDKNTFSIINNKTNKGLALRTTLNQKLTKDASIHKLSYQTYFQHISANYISPEHFKNVEFQRDWNYQYNVLNNELQSGMLLNYQLKKFFKTSIGSDWLSAGNTYKANKHSTNIIFNPNKWNFYHSGSLLNSQKKHINTQFIRYYSTNERQFSNIKLGFKTSYEDNQWHLKSKDSLLNNSFKFYHWNGYVVSADTSLWQWLIRYGQRQDFHPLNNKLKKTFTTQEMGIEAQSDMSKKFIVKTIWSIRDLRIHKDTISPREHNLVSRNEFLLKLAKNAINISTIHETNAGIEPKRQFTYLEVPAGQGIFTWIDYNNNGIKELNEFEIAKYSDQATYIRIASSTLEYIKVYNSKISQTLNIRPELYWNNHRGFKKFLTNFSNQTSFQQEIKTTSPIFIQKILPIISNDTNQLLVNTILRNVFSIRKNHPTWGMDYIFQQQQNGQLLIQGIDNRWQYQHNITFRWNIYSLYSIFISPSIGQKKFTSEFFANKNYNITFKLIENNLFIQPDNFTRFGIGYKYNQKQNLVGNETLKASGIVLEINKSIQSNNQLIFKTEFIKNKFKGNINTSVAYEILEALQPGWNMINTLQIQRNLTSTLQMVLSYQARTFEKTKTIHTGNVEIRAWF